MSWHKISGNLLSETIRIYSWLRIGNKVQWNLNQNTTVFIQGNWFESVVCKIAAILSWPQCVNHHCWPWTWGNVLGLVHVNSLDNELFDSPIEYIKTNLHSSGTCLIQDSSVWWSFTFSPWQFYHSNISAISCCMVEIWCFGGMT